MDIILIPGFWLDGSSWDEVVPALEKAGHRTHALTLPGMESKDADRSGITLRDHVDAVVAIIDSLDPAAGQVVLVGHSGGGAVVHAAADSRPGRIARVVYVDSGPLGDGGVIDDDLPAENGEVPLPDWSLFEDEDLVDLGDELRAAFRARAIPTPSTSPATGSTWPMSVATTCPSPSSRASSPASSSGSGSRAAAIPPYGSWPRSARSAA
jgi:pimeloyl-ACP methyl ester carboxylesterase